MVPERSSCLLKKDFICSEDLPDLLTKKPLKDAFRGFVL